ncbi:hypothetical protein [Pontibacter russatus]|uniref:hypothetical protein n=1 Tax=Pontibacter russatus TaxID=2694929 RepID=UPI001379D8D7|nr:hypothetical protein [Pontibacter russatus]
MDYLTNLILSGAHLHRRWGRSGSGVVFPGFAYAFAKLEVKGVVALVYVTAFVEEELLL